MPENTEPQKILVVAGEENILRLLELKLGKAGFLVSTSLDGDDGYLKARAFRPDLVIVGETIGPIDSHSLIRSIVLLPDPPPVIALSSTDSPEHVTHALRAGCDDYVLIPFSPHELIHRIHVTLLRRAIQLERIS